MSRRSDHSREEIGEMALAAARDIVENDGFGGLSARRVAARIGYSAGTLYNIFHNIDDLILHLLGQVLDDLEKRLAAAGEEAGSGAQLLAWQLDVYLDYLADHPRLWALLFEHKLPDGVDLPLWYYGKIDVVLHHIEGAMAPLFRPGDIAGPGGAARLLWAGLHGICSLSSAGKLVILTDRSDRDMAHQLLRYVIAGIEADNQRQ